MSEFELYPFLSESKGDLSAVMDDVRSSTLQKARDISELRAALRERHADDIASAARLMADAFAAGGKLLAFGNGGSATDARDLVADLTDPPVSGWRSLPALDLTRDVGIVTAVANDVGFESVFVRQVIAYGEEGDVAVGFSTSGRSGNVIEAFERARELGMKTIGLAGYEGGLMAEKGFLDVVIVAPSDHIPRIQEAHATAYHTLIAMVQEILGERADGADAADRERAPRA